MSALAVEVKKRVEVQIPYAESKRIQKTSRWKLPHPTSNSQNSMFLSKGNLILECPFGAFKYSKKAGGR